MPIRSIVDGEEIYASELSATDATMLKVKIAENELDVIMPCCDNRGHLKISHRENPFFCHNPGTKNTCGWKPETKQHRLLKEIIRHACIDKGWEATTEYQENSDWRADIFTTNGIIKLAFEVQLAKQNFAETVVRNNKYSAAGVHCCWLFKELPKVIEIDGLTLVNDHKMYELVFQGNDEIIVTDGTFEQGVYDFVQDYLEEQVRAYERKHHPVEEVVEIKEREYQHYFDEDYIETPDPVDLFLSGAWKFMVNNKEVLLILLLLIIAPKVLKAIFKR